MNSIHSSADAGDTASVCAPARTIPRSSRCSLAPAPAFDLRLDRHPLDGGVMDAGLEDYRAYGPALDEFSAAAAITSPIP